MSRKKIPRQITQAGRQRSKRKKYISVAALGLITVLCLGTLAGPWRNSPGAKRFRALFAAPAPPPPLPSPNNPSKEYIYAGGKLIATEAPLALVAPASLIATTLSDLSSPQVSISWGATTGADHYQVERTTNVNTSYTVLNSSVSATSFTDNSVSAVTAYIYRVRAVDASGNVSQYSNIDLATAISFTDDSLVAASTTIKVAHLTELRQAVNAVRLTTASLGTVTWAENIAGGVTPIRASHIQELRTKLDEARSALGLPACSYSDASVGAFVQKTHIDELRQCVR